MMNHPMEKTIVGIIRSSHFIWASSLWQLELVTFVEQVKKCHHMLIFEGVLSLILWNSVGVTLLWSSSSIYFQCWCIRRFSRVIAFVVDSPPAFGGIKLFSWFFSYLGLFNNLLPSVGFDGAMRTSTLSRKLCLHVWSNIGKGIPAGHMGEMLRNLSM